MTTSLVPMSDATFAAFCERAIVDYARDNAQTGRWPEHEAADRSRAEFQRLLPQGLATPGHFLYEIRSEPEGQAVGALWFGIDTNNGSGAGYLFNIHVDPAFRGRGHAKAALDRAEDMAAWGCTAWRCTCSATTPAPRRCTARAATGRPGSTCASRCGVLRATEPARGRTQASRTSPTGLLPKSVRCR